MLSRSLIVWSLLKYVGVPFLAPFGVVRGRHQAGLGQLHECTSRIGIFISPKENIVALLFQVIICDIIQ